jgi:hypothetical protein
MLPFLGTFKNLFFPYPIQDNLCEVGLIVSVVYSVKILPCLWNELLNSPMGIPPWFYSLINEDPAQTYVVPHLLYYLFSENEKEN